MTLENETHIEENLIIRSVADDAELPQSVYDHLNSCPDCRAKKERLQTYLQLFSEKTKQLSPAPARQIRIPDHAKTKPMPWLGNWHTASALAAAAAVILIAIILPSTLNTVSQQETGGAFEDIWEIDPQMEEIINLSENALPDVLMEIAGDSYAAIDDEFMQFVVPPITDIPMSQNNMNKGVSPC